MSSRITTSEGVEIENVEMEEKDPHQTVTIIHRAPDHADNSIKPYLLPKESPMHVPPHVVLSRIDDDVERLKKEIRQLRRRNYDKDKGKEFEGSYTRVGFIMVITYITLSGYMYLIGVQDPLLNAIVPTVGFNLSTWSLPWVKKVWTGLYDWNYGRGGDEMSFDQYDEMERGRAHN
mmetsp:Transcript_3931/g.6164  ORF Transcript_3931/g.6164 Transcript_3931/m.6164 type:complete len:176 (+) Transcript_3931:126-653(+)